MIFVSPCSYTVKNEVDDDSIYSLPFWASPQDFEGSWIFILDDPLVANFQSYQNTFCCCLASLFFARICWDNLATNFLAPLKSPKKVTTCTYVQRDENDLYNWLKMKNWNGLFEQGQKLVILVVFCSCLKLEKGMYTPSFWQLKKVRPSQFTYITSSFRAMKMHKLKAFGSFTLLNFKASAKVEEIAKMHTRLY